MCISARFDWPVNGEWNSVRQGFHPHEALSILKVRHCQNFPAMTNKCKLERLTLFLLCSAYKLALSLSSEDLPKNIFVKASLTVFLNFYTFFRVNNSKIGFERSKLWAGFSVVLTKLPALLSIINDCSACKWLLIKLQSQIKTRVCTVCVGNENVTFTIFLQIFS